MSFKLNSEAKINTQSEKYCNELGLKNIVFEVYGGF